MTLNERLHHDRLLAEAVTDAAAGRAEQALRTARRVLRHQPAHLAARRLVARLLTRAGRLREAIVELDSIDWYTQANDPTLQGAGGVTHLSMRGEVLAQLGDTEGAIGAYEALLKHRPNQAKALRRLAAIQAAAGRTDDAIVRLEQLGERRTAGDTRRLVTLYDKVGRSADACRELETIALSEPADRLWQARLLLRAQRIADAVAALERLTETNDDDASLHLEAATLAEELGDTARMARHLDRALRVEPTNREALAMSARRRMHAGRFAAAGRRWWRLIRRCGEDDEALAHLAVCGACERRTKLAVWAERALRRRCSSERAHRLIAEAWRAATPGRLIERFDRGSIGERGMVATLCDEAAATFEKSLAEHPEFADHRYHLAVCQSRCDHKAIAAESADAALGVNPAYIAAARLRIQLFIEEGQLADAHARVEQTLAEKPDTDRLLDLQVVLDVLGGDPAAAEQRLAAAAVEPIERVAITHDIAHLLEQIDHPSASAWRARCVPVRRAA